MAPILEYLSRFATPIPPFARAAAVTSAMVATVLVLPSSALSQNVLLDRGTFLLSRNGEPMGTEDFTIRRSGAGATAKIVATGEVSLEVDGERRRITSALETTGPSAVVTAYQVKESGALQSELYMTLGGNRFQAKVVTPEGEQAREYRASPVLVLLEEWMVHHFYFASARLSGPSATVPALIPRSGESIQLHMTDTGTEGVQVAGRRIEARHLRIENDQVRDVWVDDRGRILLLVNRTTGFRAERRELPD